MAEVTNSERSLQSFVSTWHDLVNFLATNLEATVSVRQRQLLVTDTGLDYLAADLVFEGSARTFTQELLQKLHARGSQELIRFLSAVQSSYPWGVEDDAKIGRFLSEIEAQKPQWRSWRGRLPRIYLAYERGARDAGALLAELKPALLSGGFEIVDLATAAGENEYWRTRLLQGIGNCHGGVILIEDQGLSSVGESYPEQNPFFEDATMLRWRDWRDEAFLLVPVAAGDVLTRLAAPPWQQLDIPELQPLLAGDNQHTVAQILERLAPLHERTPPPTWVETMEKDLAYKLRRVSEYDPQRLEDALDALDGGLAGDENAYTLERRVARALLGKGLVGMGPIIDRVAGSGLPPAALDEMLERLRSSWVDLRAAALIPRYAFMPAQKRVFCVNGQYPHLTGRGYVDQACQDHRGLEYYWKTIEVTEDDVDAVIDEIRAGLVDTFRSLRRQRQNLERRFGTNVAKINEELDKLINQKLTEWEDERMPVFVLFAPGQFDPVKLEQIRAMYRRLTLFLLVGNHATTSPLQGVDMLLPRLPEDAEEREQALYDRLLDRIPG